MAALTRGAGGAPASSVPRRSLCGAEAWAHTRPLWGACTPRAANLRHGSPAHAG